MTCKPPARKKTVTLALLCPQEAVSANACAPVVCCGVQCTEPGGTCVRGCVRGGCWGSFSRLICVGG